MESRVKLAFTPNTSGRKAGSVDTGLVAYFLGFQQLLMILACSSAKDIFPMIRECSLHSNQS